MDSLNLCKSRSSGDEEFGLYNARTADCSPLTQLEKEKQSLRASHRSKFSKSIIQGSKLNFSQFDSESSEYKGVSRFSCAVNSKIGSCGLALNKTDKDDKNMKIKIYFLIPEEIVSQKCPLKPSSTQTTKNGFIIDFVIVDILVLNLKVADLIEIAIKKVNHSLQGRFDYFFSPCCDNFTLRASKRSGLPDFDLPGTEKIN